MGELKNVKLKIPKVPTTIFGRLMAKDDYFPTAIGTFDFEIKRSSITDKRSGDSEVKKKAREDDGSRKDPETLPIPLMSSWKMQAKDSKEEKYVKIGLLTIRVIGYVQEQVHEGKQKSPTNQAAKGKAMPSGGNAAAAGNDAKDVEEEEEDDEYDEEDEEEDEEDEEEEG